MAHACAEGLRLWKVWMAACAIVQVRVEDEMTVIDELAWQEIEDNRSTRAYQRGYLAYREHRMNCQECRSLWTAA